MKKLLAGLLIGGLFSLGCGDTATTTKEKKPVTPPPNRRPMEGEIPKHDTKKDDSKKNENKKDSN